MNGAIFYASKYGSTAEYAHWIGEAAKLPMFDIHGSAAVPGQYDFVILGSPVIYHKLLADRWIRRHEASILDRPTLLFSVSGAGPGEKLDRWIEGCLSSEMISHVVHFALLGRQSPKDLNWFDRIMLIVAGLVNRDRAAGKEEMQGFDFMDRSSIEPIVEMARQLQIADRGEGRHAPQRQRRGAVKI